MLFRSEKYDSKSRTWVTISSLNTPDFGITAFYAMPHYIYTCGGYSQSSYEKYSFDPSIKEPKWEKLQIHNSSRRSYGIAFQINSEEAIICGGGFSESVFIKYNIKNQQLFKTEKSFNSNYYNETKGTFFKRLFHIYDQSKKSIIKINSIDLSWNEEQSNF